MSSSDLTKESATNLQQTEPTLCSNGCGFFGTPETKGLCSKCYRDLTKSLTPPSASSACLSIKATPNSFFPWAATTKSSSAALVEKVESKTEEKKNKNRCGKCNKKVGLTGFQCRCGNLFCGSHRYAEAHECGFDFKGKGRSEIAKANPVVKDDKLERI